MVKFQINQLPSMSLLYAPLDYPLHIRKLCFIDIGHSLLVIEAKHSGGLVGSGFAGE